MQVLLHADGTCDCSFCLRVHQRRSGCVSPGRSRSLRFTLHGWICRDWDRLKLDSEESRTAGTGKLPKKNIQPRLSRPTRTGLLTLQIWLLRLRVLTGGSPRSQHGVWDAASRLNRWFQSMFKSSFNRPHNSPANPRLIPKGIIAGRNPIGSRLRIEAKINIWAGGHNKRSMHLMSA